MEILLLAFVMLFTKKRDAISTGRAAAAVVAAVIVVVGGGLVLFNSGPSSSSSALSSAVSPHPPPLPLSTETQTLTSPPVTSFVTSTTTLTQPVSFPPPATSTLTSTQTLTQTSTMTSTATSTLTQTTTQTTTVTRGSIAHVILILMENEESGSVIGNSSAPYENQLAAKYALAGNYYAVSHPSLPNYLALVAGTTFGVSSDCIPSQCSFSNSTLANLIDSHGLTWREYAESMPANCSENDGPGGLYYAKHNPFVYFSQITGNDGTGAPSPYCDSHVVPFTQFWNDLGSGNLPSYSFITPNICDDAHSCPLSTGDQWLSTVVPRIINSSSFSSTALFITYDEGSTDAGFGQNDGGHVVCLLVSPFAKHGYVSPVQYSHYSLLATTEAILGVGNLGRNDSTANTMGDLFTSPVG